MLKSTKYLRFVLLIISITSCNTDTRETPEFHSYDQAIEWYENQNLDTTHPDSTAISKASYHHRDEVLLIYYVSKPGKGYIFGNIPRSVWEEFKSSSSKGSYFNERIKGRYRYRLNEEK
jgi:hypothetical protein